MIDARAGARTFLTSHSFLSRQRRTLAFVGVLAAIAAPSAPVAQAASANGGPLDIRDIHVQSRHTFSYTCADGKTFKVSYLNAANGQSFALVPVEGRKLLLVGVVAASGVKYVGDRYAWWTKGPGGDLYDTMADPNSKPIVAGCATIMR
ncbi:MliC family protein [Paraburkholderia bannensis]|uniref:MliC family protein n=1 Tax=Paraburkholderia bannensis TaxID=765414 RepID=UPI002AAFFB77|nr:MliC family protein [Paraburkholderia bannensis]